MNFGREGIESQSPLVYIKLKLDFASKVEEILKCGQKVKIIRAV